MTLGLSFILISFSIIWTALLIWCIRTAKISIKYSIMWFLAIIVIFLVGVFPSAFSLLANLFSFNLLSDFIVGILLALLLFITLALTIIVTTLKTTVRLLTEELSLAKKEIKDLKSKKSSS